MAGSPRYRSCQIDACSEHVPASLAQQGVCVGHYLDGTFTKVAKLLETSGRGQPLEPHALDWLLAQGDLTVKLLSAGGAQFTENRSRLLDLLACLANAQDYVRLSSASKVSRT